MTLKKTRKTNCFSPAEIRKLPTELRPLGEELRLSFQASGDVAKLVLEDLGYRKFKTYSHFLKKELSQLLAASKSSAEKSLSDFPSDSKAYWNHSSVSLVLETIEEGQDMLESAFSCLLEGDVRSFAKDFYCAGAEIGHLGFINAMCEVDYYRHLGSIGHGRYKATMAGIKSGAIRRQQSRVPTAENLKIARQKLVDAGKPPREISAMLAKKYDCTTDHIRKVLKRD